ncbi:MAG: ABC transporter ATP-binding protein [Raoultibacter sp.]
MLREKLALTEEGAKNLRKGGVACVVANIALMLPVSILFLVVNDFMNHLYNPASPLPNVWLYLALIVVTLVILFATQWWEYGATYNVVYAESARKRIGIAEKLRQLPLAFFGKRDLSDLTSTIMKDCADQERVFSHIMPQLIGSGISTTLIAVCLFFFDWRLALAAFWVVPFALLIVLGSARMQTSFGKKTNDRGLDLADGIQEYLECSREIRATNQSESFLSKLSEKVKSLEKAQIVSELVAGVFVTSAQGFLKLGIATTVLVGLTLLVQGETNFMVYFAFLLVVTRVYDPLNIVLQSTAELLNIRLSIKRMQEIEAEPIQSGVKEFNPSGHDLVFEDVSFSYKDGEQVLSNVSFTAKEGQVTALVGPSGGGKSTVMKLAGRFWDAGSGRVLVGGVDVSQVDPETLLQDYAEVFQEVVLFDDSVMGNIRLGKTDATDDEVLAAAKAANCDEFVSRLEQGYDTLIGENGSQLSGGERQRISIARALLKDAPIVLLDEATASLDVENETQVQQALSRLLAEKTVLVIAHRMRTVANADKIIVLNEGRVDEVGKPAELMEHENGTYRRMVSLQNQAAAWAV